MNESPIDPSDEAVPQPPANADGDDGTPEGEGTPEQVDPRERLIEAFEEAAEKEAIADAAIEAALEETVEEAIEDAEAVEEASDQAIQDRFEERVEKAAEQGLEGEALEDAVGRAAAEADLQEAIADDAIEAALEETVGEAVADAASVEEMSDAAIVGELADEVESIAEDVERTESAEAVGDAASTEDPDATDVAAAAAPADRVEGNGVAPAESAEEEEPEPPAARDPFRSPGDWYVVHTYAGYENKVKTNLESRIHTMQMEDKIFDVHIPMEDVMEIKGGKKQVVQRKVFPGYLLVKMIYDNDSWYVVRNTPGVTGFVAAGTGSKPTPLSRREVEKILSVKKEEVKPQLRLGFEVDDVVRIISGPFADFNGTISDINPEQGKLRVLVNIFDRETPVELSFDQVAKV
jgi:transcription termination/antitermination protein NusG